MVEQGIRSHTHSKSAARCSTQAFKAMGFFPVTLFKVSVSMTALPSRTACSDCAMPSAIGARSTGKQALPERTINGSSIAALLVLAHALVDNPQRRTLRFVAFTNEERPF